MRCRQSEKLLFDYIDGMISESDRLKLERHLSECRACEATSASLAKSLGLLHRLPKSEPSENFNWKLRLRLARERNAWRGGTEAEEVWQRAWHSRFALGAVSAFALVLVAGFAFLKISGAPGVFHRDGTGPSADFETAPRTSVVETGRKAGGSVSTLFDLDASGGFGAHGVSSGSPSPLGIDVSRGGALLEADSLGYRTITGRYEYQRIQLLEQQIEILRKELDNCNLGQGK